MSNTFYGLKNTGFSILKNTPRSNDNSKSDVLNTRRLIEFPESRCGLAQVLQKRHTKMDVVG